MFPLCPVDGDALGAEAVRQLMENVSISKTVLTAALTGFVSGFIGFALKARIMQAQGGPAARYAVVAGVLFPIFAAVGLASYGLQMGTMGIAETDPVGATATNLVGSYIGDPIVLGDRGHLCSPTETRQFFGWQGPCS